MQPRRLRRRGPRSFLAQVRRSAASHASDSLDHSSSEEPHSGLLSVSPPGGDLCEARSLPPVESDDITFLHVNIQGFRSHAAELAARVELLPVKPALLLLNETFLDQSVVEIAVPGYQLVARLDRRDGRQGGGVAVFALEVYAAQVTHLADSEHDERAWLLIHSDLGPILVCCWYRPPCAGEVESIRNFAREWEDFSDRAIGLFCIGDLNLHHIGWLRHSSHNSVEGTLMMNTCLQFGLHQIVRAPTRGRHILDLVLTDLGDSCCCTVVPGIADHCLLLLRVRFPVPRNLRGSRGVWLYKRANWRGVQRDLLRLDWQWVDSLDSSAAAARLTATILQVARQHIPVKRVALSQEAHPWLNDRCRQLVQQKVAAAGTDGASDAAALCSRGLLEEYRKWVENMRARMRSLRRGSKEWWKLSRQLLGRVAASSGMPALRDASGTWVFESKDKANLLASTFSAKFGLPAAVQNEFSQLANTTCAACGFLPLRTRHGQTQLGKLRVQSGTGPDLLSAFLPHTCAGELAIPFTKLARNILRSGIWPNCWRHHWLFALHKRKSVYDTENYRGIHLTAQMSKAMGRFIGKHFLPQLERSLAYGPNQFAHWTGHGARHAVAFYVLQWILHLDSGK